MVNQRWLKIPVIIGVLLVFGGTLIIPVHIPVAESFRTPATATVPSTPLIQGVEVVQQFPATGAPITAIAIQLATYKRVNAGTVQLTVRVIRGGQWQVLAVRTAAKERLRDNAFQSFDFSPPLIANPDEILAIAVAADQDSSQAISWWIDPTLSRASYQLLVDGTPQPGMAVFSIAYAQKSGPLLTLLPEVWQRLTVFLDPLWQALLLLGIALALFPLLWIVRRILRPIR